jgi:hypothetical protein
LYADKKVVSVFVRFFVRHFLRISIYSANYFSFLDFIVLWLKILKFPNAGVDEQLKRNGSLKYKCLIVVTSIREWAEAIVSISIWHASSFKI